MRAQRLKNTNATVFFCVKFFVFLCNKRNHPDRMMLNSSDKKVVNHFILHISEPHLIQSQPVVSLVRLRAQRLKYTDATVLFVLSFFLVFYVTNAITRMA